MSPGLPHHSEGQNMSLRLDPYSQRQSISVVLEPFEGHLESFVFGQTEPPESASARLSSSEWEVSPTVQQTETTSFVSVVGLCGQVCGLADSKASRS